LQTLREVIYESFKVLGESNSVDGSDPSTFGYKSHHYICAVRDDYTGPRYDGLKDLKVEIQCRTIAMDAWASISHYLAYKSASSVPDDLQRDFAALSGLFYVADRHFQHFSETSKTVEEKALRLQESGSDDADAVALDRASVTGLFYRIYRDRDRADQASISQFVEEVLQLSAGCEQPFWSIMILHSSSKRRARHSTLSRMKGLNT
jgi:putative GTP pyrophosphokinase